MKTIILILLFSSVSQAACLNKISLIEAQKAVAHADTIRPSCEDSSPCLCFDGIDFDVAELKQDASGNYFLQNNATLAAAKATQLAQALAIKTQLQLDLAAAVASMDAFQLKSNPTNADAIIALKALIKHYRNKVQ